MPGNMIEFKGSIDAGVAISIRMLSGKKQIDQKFKLEHLMSKDMSEQEKAGIQIRRAANAPRRAPDQDASRKDSGASNELQQLWARLRNRRGADEEFTNYTTSTAPPTASDVTNTTTSQTPKSFKQFKHNVTTDRAPPSQSELGAMLARVADYTKTSQKDEAALEKAPDEDKVAQQRQSFNDSQSPSQSSSAPAVSSVTDFLSRLKQSKISPVVQETTEAPTGVDEVSAENRQVSSEVVEAPKGIIDDGCLAQDNVNSISRAASFVSVIDERRQDEAPANVNETSLAQSRSAAAEQKEEEECISAKIKCTVTACGFDLEESVTAPPLEVNVEVRQEFQASSDITEASGGNDVDSRRPPLKASSSGQSLKVSDESETDGKEVIECQVVSSFFSSDRCQTSSHDDEESYVGSRLSSMWRNAIDTACPESDVENNQLPSSGSAKTKGAPTTKRHEEVECKKQKVERVSTRRGIPVRLQSAAERHKIHTPRQSADDASDNVKFHSFATARSNCGSFCQENKVSSRHSSREVTPRKNASQSMTNHCSSKSADNEEVLVKSSMQDTENSEADLQNHQRAFYLYNDESSAWHSELSRLHIPSRYDIGSSMEGTPRCHAVASSSNFFSPTTSVSFSDAWLRESNRSKPQNAGGHTNLGYDLDASDLLHACSSAQTCSSSKEARKRSPRRSEPRRRTLRGTTVRNPASTAVKKPQVARRCCVRGKIPASELQTTTPVVSKGPQISRRCCAAVKTNPHEPAKRRQSTRPRSSGARLSQRNCCLIPRREADDVPSGASRASPFTAPQRGNCVLM